MDVYPEIATDVGVMRRGSVGERLIRALAHGSRRRADRVWVLGECMRRRIVAAGCDPDRIEVHENWSDAHLYEGAVAPQPDRVRLLYSGNLGRSHDVATLAGAAAALRDDTRIAVHIAGGGAERAGLEAEVRDRGLTNVTFLPYAPYQELGRVLSSADVGLVTLRDACAGAVVPSKVYGLMACGRPVLFVGPEDSTPALIIRRFNCGWRVACGDVTGLVETLRMLASRPDVIRDAGARARAAFLEHYTREASVRRLCDAIARLQPVNASHAATVVRPTSTPPTTPNQSSSSPSSS
jgi:glycosyltransferase involved in cell wall biosynthesis